MLDVTKRTMNTHMKIVFSLLIMIINCMSLSRGYSYMHQPETEAAGTP